MNKSMWLMGMVVMLIVTGCVNGNKPASQAVKNSGVEYYVDKNSLGGPANDTNPGTMDKPWMTLKRAFDVKQATVPGPGDTVFIRNGVYKETMTIVKGGMENKPLTIQSYPGEQVVIDGEGKRGGIILTGTYMEEAKITTPQTPHGEGQADYVVIDGIRVINGEVRKSYLEIAPDLKTGVICLGRKGIVLRNLDVAGWDRGIQISSCKQVRIVKNHAHHCSSPVLITACNDVFIEDNEIHHCEDGIFFWGAGPSIVNRVSSVKGKVGAVTQIGPGLAAITTGQDDFLFNLKESYTGTLRGQGDVEKGLAQNPHYLLLFSKEISLPPDHYLKNVIPGGTVPLADGRKWFPLQNNPAWDNKPFSPDGKQCLFSTGGADMKDLSAVKYFFLARSFKEESVTTYDAQILRNHIHDTHRQGLLFFMTSHALVKDNRIHQCGCTGIQVETGCRNFWIEGNEVYDNNVVFAGECNIWVSQDQDVVIQRNRMSRSGAGAKVTASQDVLFRWNLIYDNLAQNVKDSNVANANRTITGLSMNGGTYFSLGAPATVRGCAFVHNTFYGNGHASSSFAGGIYFNFRGSGMEPPIDPDNVILNNLVQNVGCKYVFTLADVVPIICDGNMYYSRSGAAKVGVAFGSTESTYGIKGGKEFDLTVPAEFESYRKTFKMEKGSTCQEAAFVNAAGADFHLAKGSKAIDAGVALTRTTNQGKGQEIPMGNVWSFSAGFQSSKGVKWVEGDEIMVGKEKVRVVAVDREKNVLKVDRAVQWEKDTPVNYAYTGAGPDIGAVESR